MSLGQEVWEELKAAAKTDHSSDKAQLYNDLWIWSGEKESRCIEWLDDKSAWTKGYPSRAHAVRDGKIYDVTRAIRFSPHL